MIKAVLFDFYGTLVEEDDLYIKLICEDIYTNSPKDFELSEIGTFWYKRFSNIFKSSFESTYLLQRDIELASLKETITHFNSRASAEVLSEILFSYWSSPKPLENTRYVIDKLSLPTCVVSNIDNRDLASALKNISYEPDHVVTSETEKSYKPRPEMFEKALKLLKLSHSEVVHVGDSYTSDIVGAYNLGIPSVWLNSSKRMKTGDIEPCHVIENIIDILNIIDNYNNESI